LALLAKRSFLFSVAEFIRLWYNIPHIFDKGVCYAQTCAAAGRSVVGAGRRMWGGVTDSNAISVAYACSGDSDARADRRGDTFWPVCLHGVTF
jgi:hypothetical protein